jgi:CspA family cold shock protein
MAEDAWNSRKPARVALAYTPDSIGLDEGGKDIFVHVTALGRTGLTSLAEGQRVRMQVGQGKKGAEAKAIELID